MIRKKWNVPYNLFSLPLILSETHKQHGWRKSDVKLYFVICRLHVRYASEAKSCNLFVYRMCLQCGVPKTFSNAQGMVCPLCSDRPFAETDKESKKKSSAIKDKEKNKRMKGQSSHATWKSETEMQLRQQFD